MRSQWIKSFVAGLALVAVSIPLCAQDSAGGIVAVLDVARVFKENTAFDGQMKSIKAEADQLKATIQQKQEKIRQDAAGLSQYEVGTAERNQMEASLEQRQTALRTEARQKEQELLNREARIYYQTYQQMQQVVGQVAKEYQIGLVLRFDSAPIDADNRTEVIKGVNRNVVYHYKLDLTNMVIKKMGPAMAQAQGNQNK